MRFVRLYSDEHGTKVIRDTLVPWFVDRFDSMPARCSCGDSSSCVHRAEIKRWIRPSEADRVVGWRPLLGVALILKDAGEADTEAVRVTDREIAQAVIPVADGNHDVGSDLVDEAPIPVHVRHHHPDVG
jgi:hypothetical protein